MRFELMRSFQILTVVAALLSVFTFTVNADLSDETISVYYSFDGEGETVVDGSLSGNDGTIVGNVNRADGVMGKAIVLETDSWIDMNGPEFQNLPNDGFTIATWVNHTGSSDPQTLLDAIGTDHGSGLFHMEIRPGGFRFFHRNHTNTTVFNINPGPVLEANKWVHFAGTYDTESGEIKTYVDGEETHSAVGGGELAANWGVSAGIGHHKNGRWFNGMLDEYYIFARAVSAEEIQQIMEGAFATPVEPQDKLSTTWGNIKSRNITLQE